MLIINNKIINLEPVMVKLYDRTCKCHCFSLWRDITKRDTQWLWFVFKYLQLVFEQYIFPYRSFLCYDAKRVRYRPIERDREDQQVHRRIISDSHKTSICISQSRCPYPIHSIWSFLSKRVNPRYLAGPSSADGTANHSRVCDRSPWPTYPCQNLQNSYKRGCLMQQFNILNQVVEL